MSTANLKNMTKEQLVKMLEQTQQAQASGLMVKLNSSGGIYIRSSNFKAWSTSKNKEYIAGINMPVSVAKALFNDASMLELIKDEVNKIIANQDQV